MMPVCWNYYKIVIIDETALKGLYDILTDYFEIVIIKIPKVVKAYQKTPNDEVLQWMLFLDNPEKKNEKILNTK